MSTRAVCIALFLLVLLNAAYVSQSWGPNQLSRFSLLYAMIYEHTLNIDTNAAMNLDKAEVGGHFYSDKAPGTAFLALPGFALTNSLLNILGVDSVSYVGIDLSATVATATSSGLLAALGTVAFWLLLARLLQPAAAGAAAVGLALGTIQLPYSTMLFSHAATMGLLCIALLLTVSPRPKRQTDDTVNRACKRNAGAGLLLLAGTATGLLPLGGMAFTVGVTVAMVAGLALLARAVTAMADDGLPAIDRDCVAGLACGLAVIGEYTAGIAMVGLLLLAARDRPARAGWMLLGALSPLLLCAAYNATAFGSPLSIGYQHNGYAWMQQGLFGISLTFNADALSALLFSQGRGLFFWSPFLLLCLPGYRTLFGKSRPLFWLCLLVPLITLGLLCTMASPYGGSAVGPRYLAPAIPFVAIAAAYGLLLLPHFGRVLIAISVAMNLLATLVNALMPEMVPSPFFDYYLANGLAGNFPVNMGIGFGLPPSWSVAPIIFVDLLTVAWMLRIPRGAKRTAKKQITPRRKTATA